MLIFSRHLQMFWDGILSKLPEFRISNNVYNAFTGIQHFLCKIFWNKYRGFCYSEFNGPFMNRIQIFKKCLVFFFCKIFIELLANSWNHTSSDLEGKLIIN